MRLSVVFLCLIMSCNSNIHGWFSASVSSIAQFASKGIARIAHGSCRTGLWAVNHPILSVAALGVVLYASKDLRDLCYKGGSWLFDKYKAAHDKSLLVGLANTVSGAYRLFNPTVLELAQKRHEVEKAQQQAQKLEQEVKSAQDQNALLAGQLEQLQALVNSLQAQLGTALDTKKDMGELSCKFGLLTSNVQTLQQSVEGETGLKATLKSIQQVLLTYEQSMRRVVDENFVAKMKECQAQVQQLLDASAATKKKECEELVNSARQLLASVSSLVGQTQSV